MENEIKHYKCISEGCNHEWSGNLDDGIKCPACGKPQASAGATIMGILLFGFSVYVIIYALSNL